MNFCRGMGQRPVSFEGTRGPTKKFKRRRQFKGTEERDVKNLLSLREKGGVFANLQSTNELRL